MTTYDEHEYRKAQGMFRSRKTSKTSKTSEQIAMIDSAADRLSGFAFSLAMLAEELRNAGLSKEADVVLRVETASSRARKSLRKIAG